MYCFHFICETFFSRSLLLGTLSNNDDDGSENITKKKVNLRPFKLYRV